MTVEDNVATFRRWFDEGCSRGNVNLADELYSPDYVTHSVGPDLPPTLEGLKMFIRALRQGIPDLQCPMEEVVAEGDRVAGRFTMGHARRKPVRHPSHREGVNVGVMVIARFDEAGKWVEDWASWDQLGMLQQLASFRRRPRHKRGAAIMAANVTSTDANKALVRRAIGYNHGRPRMPPRSSRPTSWRTCRASRPWIAPPSSTSWRLCRRLPRLHLQDPGSDRAGRPRRQPHHLAGHPRRPVRRHPRHRTADRVERYQHVQSEGRPRRGAVGRAGLLRPAPADRGHPPGVRFLSAAVGEGSRCQGAAV